MLCKDSKFLGNTSVSLSKNPGSSHLSTFTAGLSPKCNLLYWETAREQMDRHGLGGFKGLWGIASCLALISTQIYTFLKFLWKCQSKSLQRGPSLVERLVLGYSHT